MSGINIGPVHKKDVLRANVMNEKKCPKYACILAFDVPVNKEVSGRRGDGAGGPEVVLL